MRRSIGESAAGGRGSAVGWAPRGEGKPRSGVACRWSEKRQTKSFRKAKSDNHRSALRVQDGAGRGKLVDRPGSLCSRFRRTCRRLSLRPTARNSLPKTRKNERAGYGTWNVPWILATASWAFLGFFRRPMLAVLLITYREGACNKNLAQLAKWRQNFWRPA